MNKYTIIVFVLIVLLVVSCCNGNNDVKQSKDYATTTLALMKPDVVVSKVYTANSLNQSTYSSMIQMQYDKSVRLTGNGQLTNKELIRLGVWEDEDELEHSLRTLSMRIGRFHTMTGRLPEGPEDVFEVLGNENCVKSDIYNPITGNYYNSFTSVEWDENAVFIERTDDPDEALRIIQEHYPEVAENIDGVTYPNPKTALHMVVYGEEPGSVIFDDYFF